MSLVSDTHGQLATRLDNIERNCSCISKENTGVIVLGDAGINDYLNNTDAKWKKIINNHGIYVYCVRGNHEERPQNIDTMVLIEDENVGNCVWYEPKYPFIRYFSDGATYNLVVGQQTYKTLVIGGAYSIDKEWRLQKNAQWFPQEQLSQEEMEKISFLYEGDTFDLILSHTCPFSWQPTDLFLSFINQDAVDKSMELWMDKLKDQVNWNVWLFGHFHDDRLVRPHVEMFFNDYEDLAAIFERWNNEDEIPWWMKKDPNYHMGT